MITATKAYSDSRPDVLKLAREMALERARRFSSPECEFTPSVLATMPADQVATLPEFSITTIVHTYAVLMANGIAPIDALQGIEAKRAGATAATFHRPFDLEQYIHAVIGLIHPDSQLPYGWVDACIDHCRLVFDLGPRPIQLLEPTSIPTVS